MPPATENADKEETARNEAADWLMRLRAAPGDNQLRDELDAWLSADEAHRRAYRSVERMWHLAGDLPPDYAEQAGPTEQPAGAAQALSRGHGHRRPRSRADGHQRTGRRRAAIGVAASALAAGVLLMLLPALLLHLQADYTTGIGEVREVELKDGSVVHLGADSAIAVDYDPSRRNVALLSGHAFFEVAEAAATPFVVTADGVTATVTGTAFAMRSSSETVSVTLQSGSVEVALNHGNGGSADLSPGERVSVDRHSGHFMRTSVARQNIGSWRYRRLVVDGATLAEVVEDLARYHRGIIVLRDEALAARRVTAVLDLDHPIDALRTIVQTVQGRVTEVTPFLLVVTGR